MKNQTNHKYKSKKLHKSRKGRPSGWTVIHRSTFGNFIKFLSPTITTSDVHRVFSIYDDIVKRHGRTLGLKYAKWLYLLFVRSVLNQVTPSHTLQEGPIWTQLLTVMSRGKIYRGVPSSLTWLIVKLSRAKDQIGAMRATFTLLSHFRLLTDKPNPDLKAITSPLEGVINYNLLLEVRRTVRREKLRLAIPLIDQPVLDYDGKSGPNGPSVREALQDLWALREDPIVLQNLTDFLDFFVQNTFKEGYQTVRSYLGRNLHLLPENLDQCKFYAKAKVSMAYHSALRMKCEGGGKTRVFAISDYFTKMALKPLHRAVANILDTIEEDCTFNQDKGAEKIKEFLETRGQNNTLESIDLKSATDRFPIELQEMALESLTGSRAFAASWRRLVCDREFQYRKKKYAYAVGQPMGFYSSWPIFALTHHLIVRMARYRLNNTNLWYVLLGDDIVLESSLAAEYRKILDEIYVKTSPVKGFSGSLAEFAKRIILPDGEVTPVSPKLITEVAEDPNLSLALCEQLGRSFSYELIYCSKTVRILSSVFHYNLGQKEVFRKILTAHLLMKYLTQQAGTPLQQGKDDLSYKLSFDPMKSRVIHDLFAPVLVIGKGNEPEKPLRLHAGASTEKALKSFLVSLWEQRILSFSDLLERRLKEYNKLQRSPELGPRWRPYTATILHPIHGLNFATEADDWINQLLAWSPPLQFFHAVVQSYPSLKDMVEQHLRSSEVKGGDVDGFSRRYPTPREVNFNKILREGPEKKSKRISKELLAAYDRFVADLQDPASPPYLMKKTTLDKAYKLYAFIQIAKAMKKK